MSYPQDQTYNVQNTNSHGSNNNASARKRRIASMLRKRQQRIFQTNGSTSDRRCTQRTSQNVRRISLPKVRSKLHQPDKMGHHHRDRRMQEQCREDDGTARRRHHQTSLRRNDETSQPNRIDSLVTAKISGPTIKHFCPMLSEGWQRKLRLRRR